MAARYQNAEVYGPDLATLKPFVGVPWFHTFQQVFTNKYTRLKKKKLAPYICEYTLELVKAGRMKTFSKPRISDEEYAEYSWYTKRTLPKEPNAY
jgi:hypothetical protein